MRWNYNMNLLRTFWFPFKRAFLFAFVGNVYFQTIEGLKTIIFREKGLNHVCPPTHIAIR